MSLSSYFIAQKNIMKKNEKNVWKSINKKYPSPSEEKFSVYELSLMVHKRLIYNWKHNIQDKIFDPF